MTNQQLQRILKVCIIATIIMLIFDIVFSIPMIIDFFKEWITTSSGWLIFLVIWIIMFLQCTVLNIPAYVILSASVSIGLNCLSWQYLLCVITAYMAGCILAYWIGRWWGVKAVKWCAGSNEDYEKWCIVLNQKGKWYYALTVLFPFFPDDLLCIVCGSVKFDFIFFTIANLLGRTIGLIAMILTLELIGSMGGGIPIMPFVWGALLIAECIVLAILIIKNKGDKNE